MKILGREPAAFIGAIQSTLVLAVSFGWLEGVGLDGQDDVALVVGVLAGVAALVLAFATSETLLAPVLELFKAALALSAIYGFTLTTEQTGSAIAAITMLLALFQRTQVSPLATGSFALPARNERGVADVYAAVLAAILFAALAVPLLGIWAAAAFAGVTVPAIGGVHLARRRR